MTRKELDDLTKLADEELLPLVVTDIHKQQNLVSQRDDAIQRIEKWDADKAGVIKAHAEELAAKETAHAAALTAKETEKTEAIAAKEAELAAAKTLIDAMGGTAEGQRLKKERELAAALAAKEEAQRKIDELSKPVAPVVPKVR